MITLPPFLLNTQWEIYPTAVVIFVSRRALAREGDYEMVPVRVLVCHSDFSKITTATDFL